MARVLVVDNDPYTRQVIGATLRREGHEVWLAPGGLEGREAASTQRFDLVLVDYLLPDEDGITLLAALAELQPDVIRVLVSDQLNKEMMVDAINRGEVARVLRRPFPMPLMVETVHAALEMRRKDRQRSGATGTDEERKALENWLRSRDFRIALQPIVSVPDRTIVGVESSIHCRATGWGSPAKVLSTAERNRMLPEVSNAQVARLIEWLFCLPSDTRVFLGLHHDELADGGALFGRLEPLLPWADQVILQVTERCHERWPDRWMDAVAGVAAMGFALGLHDFGSGYSALEVLAGLDARFIMIDGQIVRHLHDSPQRNRLVELLVRFADAADAVIVAEDVQNEHEEKALLDCGVTLMKGSRFGRPALRSPFDG